ncbi:hypothetical protein VSX61_05170 [Brenneria populi subsp. brevivirga]|nr:hypothetical protein [Brenneria populi subsp. brevivirga]
MDSHDGVFSPEAEKGAQEAWERRQSNGEQSGSAVTLRRRMK